MLPLAAFLIFFLLLSSVGVNSSVMTVGQNSLAFLLWACHKYAFMAVMFYSLYLFEFYSHLVSHIY